MKTIRRLYLYGVAFIALQSLMWGIINLLRMLLGGTPFKSEAASLYIALIIVGLSIYLFHWLLAQRGIKDSPEERAAVPRKLYLYGELVATVIPAGMNNTNLIEDTLFRLFGGTLHSAWYPDLVNNLVAIGIAGIFWLYHWHIIRADAQAEPERGWQATLRRLYFYAVAFSGLAMLTSGAFGIVTTLARLGLRGAPQYAEVGWWRYRVSYSIAISLVGLLGWLWHWRYAQKQFAARGVGEEKSTIRKLYAYLIVFTAAVVTLSAAAYVSYTIWSNLLAVNTNSNSLPLQLVEPLTAILLGIVWWVYHWNTLKSDAADAAEAPQQASIRRLYFYLISSVGLTMLAIGIAGLLRMVIRVAGGWTPDSGIISDWLKQQFSLFISMSAVGLPAWLFHWLRVQRVAVSSANTGMDERQAIARKGYLYAFVFIAALVILGSAAWLCYRLLMAVLTQDIPADFIAQLGEAIAYTIIAAVVWVYHWQTIARDGKLEDAEWEKRLAQFSVVLLDAGELGELLEKYLRRELPQAPIVTFPQKTRQAEIISEARLIVASWQAALLSEFAEAIRRSAAHKLLLPLPVELWHWVGAPLEELEEWAEHAARQARQIAMGRAESGKEFTAGGIVGLIGVMLLLLIIFAAGLVPFMEFD